MMDDVFGYFWIILWIMIIVSNGLSKFPGLFGKVGFWDYGHKEKRLWTPWQELAKANKLTFSRGSFLVDDKVFGRYNNHFVTLETFKEHENGFNQSCTSLSVSKSNQAFYNTSPAIDGLLDKSLDINNIINLLSPKELKHDTRWRVKADPMGRRISYTQQGMQTNTKYLQFLLDWLNEVADAYPTIVALGGEAVTPLQSLAKRNSSLEPLITQLLFDVANQTKIRLGYQAKDLVCSHCLTSCGKHKIILSWWQSITYYGCRTCRQSQKFFKGWVVARLDNTMAQEQIQQDGILRVNWLSRRTLFDFDEVEIIQATDEEVERFAVQVGNDTDFLRKPRYQQMRCVVSADCGLSENSHRILRRMFGSVEVRDSLVNLHHTIDKENNVRHTDDERLMTTDEMQG